jgi:hypothetical protein
MCTDEIWVEHRSMKQAEEEKERAPIIATYAEQFRSIFESGSHADVKFIVGEDKVEIPAHRAILSARSQYFNAMLREDNAMCESVQGVVRTAHDPAVFRRMLEFIYTNTVRDLASVPSDEVIALMMLANEYLLDDLRKLCEKAATQIISIENIGRLLLLSAGHNASSLREACSEFVRENKLLLAQDANFRQDIEMNPELGLLLFESSLPKRAVSADGGDSPGWVESSSSGVGNKRRRIADQNSENELDLVPPQLGTASTSSPAAALALTHATTQHAPIAAPGPVLQAPAVATGPLGAVTALPLLQVNPVAAPAVPPPPAAGTGALV